MALEIEIRHCMYSGFASGVSQFVLKWISMQPRQIKRVMGLLCMEKLRNGESVLIQKYGRLPTRRQCFNRKRKHIAFSFRRKICIKLNKKNFELCCTRLIHYFIRVALSIVLYLSANIFVQPFLCSDNNYSPPPPLLSPYSSHAGQVLQLFLIKFLNPN